MKNSIFVFSVWAALAGTVAHAQCPGEDAEPALTVKTKAGRELFVCGFEDRDVSAKGKRAFSDFTVYSDIAKPAEEAGDVSGGKPPAHGTPASPSAQKVFASDSNETYWIKAVPAKGLEIEELWFFSDKPQAALKQEVTCTADACAVSEQKCILKMKNSPFPKALADFKKRNAAGTLNEDGEELIDQIFAQAFLGDKTARAFFDKPPEKFDASLEETFMANKRKLEIGCKK